MPSERELAAGFGVSVMTVRQALARLAVRGLVVRLRGRHGGTFVAEPRLERDLTGFAGLSDQLRRQGVEPGALVLSASEQPAPAPVASELGLEPGAGVYEIVRVRLANGEAVALERTCFPTGLLPSLLEEPLDGSLYELLRSRYGIVPQRAVERLEPVVAGLDEAASLGVARGAPLMLVERTAYGYAGEAVEHSRELYRGDRIRVVVRSELRLG